jgi:hypothetical protein
MPARTVGNIFRALPSDPAKMVAPSSGTGGMAQPEPVPPPEPEPIPEEEQDLTAGEADVLEEVAAAEGAGRGSARSWACRIRLSATSSPRFPTIRSSGHQVSANRRNLVSRSRSRARPPSSRAPRAGPARHGTSAAEPRAGTASGPAAAGAGRRRSSGRRATAGACTLNRRARTFRARAGERPPEHG